MVLKLKNANILCIIIAFIESIHLFLFNLKGCHNSKNKNKGKETTTNTAEGALLDRQFIREAFDAHNICRENHEVPKLKLNPELCKLAQKWADHIANTRNFQHSNHTYQGQSLGENIAMRYTTTSDELTGKQMTDQWYEEANTYDYSKDFQQGKGHFAQIVWANSREVGFGRAKAADGKWYAVANYYPAGNYIGQFRQNVKPQKVERL